MPQQKDDPRVILLLGHFSTFGQYSATDTLLLIKYVIDTNPLPPPAILRGRQTATCTIIWLPND